MKLGDKLAGAATEAAERNRIAAESRRQVLADQQEAEIEAIAQRFKEEHLKDIETTLSILADSGQFEYTVYHYPQFTRQSNEAMGTIRGMEYVRTWLISQGIRAELKHHEENIIDYGYVNDWTLIASWGPK